MAHLIVFLIVLLSQFVFVFTVICTKQFTLFSKRHIQCHSGGSRGGSGGSLNARIVQCIVII